jgi:hypothetical protein
MIEVDRDSGSEGDKKSQGSLDKNPGILTPAFSKDAKFNFEDKQDKQSTSSHESDYLSEKGNDKEEKPKVYMGRRGSQKFELDKQSSPQAAAKPLITEKERRQSISRKVETPQSTSGNTKLLASMWDDETDDSSVENIYKLAWSDEDSQNSYLDYDSDSWNSSDYDDIEVEDAGTQTMLPPLTKATGCQTGDSTSYSSHRSYSPIRSSHSPYQSSYSEAEKRKSLVKEKEDTLMHLLKLENEIEDHDKSATDDHRKDPRKESSKHGSYKHSSYNSASAKSTPSKKSSTEHYESKMPPSLLKPSEGIMQ